MAASVMRGEGKQDDGYGVIVASRRPSWPSHLSFDHLSYWASHLSFDYLSFARSLSLGGTCLGWIRRIRRHPTSRRRMSPPRHCMKYLQRVHRREPPPEA